MVPSDLPSQNDPQEITTGCRSRACLSKCSTTTLGAFQRALAYCQEVFGSLLESRTFFAFLIVDALFMVIAELIGATGVFGRVIRGIYLAFSKLVWCATILCIWKGVQLRELTENPRGKTVS